MVPSGIKISKGQKNTRIGVFFILFNMIETQNWQKDKDKEEV
ncbi:hypothetical protein GCWU000342_01551 [Shuttleworthella satelles DSM 14600]|uniref:Uncharacterized protein n=1 Tax=Shuttleworthella satelles DSM 14600 TaxID=626523 RepID=C4GC64_9FIRM|nr:hypothetical protein GCWU000342_01551 [Shuttleworthia satelles DSM 14600]